MTPASQPSSSAPNHRDNRMRRPLSFGSAGLRMLSVLFFTGAALVYVPRVTRCCDFAIRAASESGENPPVEVSLRVESLVRYQEYANAILTGAVLVLFLVGCDQFYDNLLCRGNPTIIRRFLAVGVSTFAGGLLGGVACWAFRRQPMGSQNLLIASFIHSAWWAAMGWILTEVRHRTIAAQCRRDRVVIAGAMWGLCFPGLVVLIWPAADVERLFANDDAALSLWAGFGCLCLSWTAASGRYLGSLCPKTSQPEMTED